MSMSYSSLAVIGFGCDLPGGSNGVEAYWDTIIQGRSGIKSSRDQRWRYSGYLDTDRTAPERTYCGLGGLLDDFTVRPGRWCSYAAVEKLNRTQMLILDTAIQALAMAGMVPGDSRLKDTSLIVGNMLADETYDHEVLGEIARLALQEAVPDPEERRPYEASLDHSLPVVDANADYSRVVPSALAHPVATLLGLQDRALVIDGACAAGLLVVDAAARYLHDRTSPFILAVGAMANMAITGNVSFSKIGGLSETDSTPLDENASGLVPGEGAGAVLLCPLAYALEHGMTVYGVIRGSATRNDGRGRAIYAPNMRGQVSAMRQAMAGGNFVADDIDHIETHATGTKAGDTEELLSIKEIASDRRSGPVSLGSVKSLTGHGFPAAGIANLVKVLLCMQHGRFAPVHGVKTPHKLIRENPDIFALRREPGTWPLDGSRPRRALVNAFGFGGVNSSVCVEQFDKQYHANLVRAESDTVRPSGKGRAVAIVATGHCQANAMDNGTLLDDDIDFDWRHFKVPPVLVPHMDGAQRLALEATRRLLAERQIDPDRCGILLGQPAGLEVVARRSFKIRLPEVISALRSTQNVDSREIDAVVSGVEKIASSIPATIEASLPGYMDNIVAGRLANVFDVRGPSMVLDAGEASFAASVDLAARYLDAGECDQMIVGSAFASRSRVHRAAGLASQGRNASVMLVRSLEWARKHPEEVLAVVEVETLSGVEHDGGFSNSANAGWVLEAMAASQNDSGWSEQATVAQSGRKFGYSVAVYDTVLSYDERSDGESASMATRLHLAAADSPEEGLRLLSRPAVANADKENGGGRFRMAVLDSDMELAEVIWRFLGQCGREEEPVRK